MTHHNPETQTDVPDQNQDDIGKNKISHKEMMGTINTLYSKVNSDLAKPEKRELIAERDIHDLLGKQNTLSQKVNDPSNRDENGKFTKEGIKEIRKAYNEYYEIYNKIQGTPNGAFSKGRNEQENGEQKDQLEQKDQDVFLESILKKRGEENEKKQKDMQKKSQSLRDAGDREKEGNQAPEGLETGYSIEFP